MMMIKQLRNFNLFDKRQKMIPNGTLTLYFEIKFNSFHPNAKKKNLFKKRPAAV